MSSGRANQLVEAGLWLRLSGDLEGARRLFEQALRLEPTHPRAQRLLQEIPSGSFISSELPQEIQVIRPQGAAAVPSAPDVAPSAPSGPTLVVAPPVTQPIQLVSRVPSPAAPPAPRAEPPAIQILPVTHTPPSRDLARELAMDATSGWDFKGSSPGVDLQDTTMLDVQNPMDWAVEPQPPMAPEPPPPATRSQVKREETSTLLEGAQELMGLDDHSGALELILKAERLAPGDASVRAMREKSERTLQSMYESKLGNLDLNPRVKLKDDEIIWLNLDHRAGFVLAQIDGGVSFEDVFAVSGMSRLDTARILAQLLDEGVIVV